MDTQLFYLHTLSALHVGTGQAVGAVDLPIARSRATHLPIVPGSGLKGVLRATCEGDTEKQAHVLSLFGPESISDSAQAQSGALMVGDAHLLLLPVRALKGVMAWLTCPFVLHRYREDLARAGCATTDLSVPTVAEGQALCTANGPNTIVHTQKDKNNTETNTKTLVFEDLDLQAVEDNNDAQEWREHLAAQFGGEAARIVIVSDNVFAYLADTATEIRTRVKINDKGVVQQGALWTEENLPSETVLWGLLGLGKVRGVGANGEDCETQWRACNPHDSLLQMGGKTTVGRGLVRWRCKAAAPAQTTAQTGAAQ
jgi:CRISPR-associated protein Cmr4